ncbi:MAG: ABC transporter permease, partial [Chloroflexi bacterium]|nr:ABC transporter permease [Chloroflexota bacterium]
MTTPSGAAADALVIQGIRRKKPTFMASALRMARRKPIGALALFMLMLLCFAAVFADVISIYNPIATSREVLRPPSFAHPFGTDNLGRDMWSRIIFGSRVSLYVGVLSVVFGTLLGSLVGLVSGFFEGKFDLIVQRVMDAMLAFPSLILAMALVSVLGPSTTNSMLAIVMTILP